MMQTSRRQFLATSAGSIAMSTVLASSASLSAAGANERVRVGLIGCGGRGRDVARTFSRTPNVEVIYLADADKGRLASGQTDFSKAKATGDFRRMLDDKTLDAVIIATPVHWHAPATILACDAGKHVYVEKPCSHNIREGRLMVEAARRNKRVVQQGTQVRSTKMMIDAVKLLREGVIGDVLMAKAWNIQVRPGNGLGAEQDPPASLDYDMWLGAAPHVPFRSSTFGGWNWLRHFGTGEIGNDGIHDLEYARWGLGVTTHPTRISGIGGRYAFDNGAEFPDTQQIAFEYAVDGLPKSRRMLVYEERLWSTNYPHNCDSGVEYYGTKGQMFLSRRGKLKVTGPDNQEVKTDVPLEAQNTDSHVADFVDAIRTDRRASADIEIGHLTASLCHLGNIAVRLARTLQFDSATEKFIGDDEADKLLAREYRSDHWAAPKG